MSIARLTRERRPSALRGEMLTSGIPSTSVSPAPGPTISNIRDDHVDVHVQSHERAHPRQRLLIVLSRERNDHPVDGELADD